jgi:hypothetical protein
MIVAREGDREENEMMIVRRGEERKMKQREKRGKEGRTHLLNINSSIPLSHGMFIPQFRDD